MSPVIGPVFLTARFLVATAGNDLTIDPVLEVDPLGDSQGYLYIVPRGGRVEIPLDMLPAVVSYSYRTTDVQDPDPVLVSCVLDLNMDGDCGTDADIDYFFSALELGVGSADFDGDGKPSTMSDIGCFFKVLGGGSC